MKCVGPTLTRRNLAHLRSEMKFTPELDELAARLALAGNTTRLRLIWLLAELEEVCVCDLAEILGLTVSAISQQLAKLKAAGLVTYRREGQTLYYRLTEHEFLRQLRNTLLAEVQI